MAESAQIKKMGGLHVAILDYMMLNPTAKKGEIAKEFEVSRSWLSIVINSHAFQDMRREREEQFFGAAVVPIREKMMGVADMALDRLMDKVEVMESAEALETADRILHRLGYAPNTRVNGQTPDLPAGSQVQQNNYFINAQTLQGAREKFGQARDVTPQRAENEPKTIEAEPQQQRQETMDPTIAGLLTS